MEGGKKRTREERVETKSDQVVQFSAVEVRPYKRKSDRGIATSSTDPILAPQSLLEQPNNCSPPFEEPSESSVAASIREKLAGKSKPSRHERKVLGRDPAIMAKIKAPVFIATQVGRGVNAEQVKRAQQEHSKKLIGWKYHVASKAAEEKKQEKSRR
uniref:Uncharacterized protein n=1 Tax=Cyanoptyche gloeocystis TaxID=77922 RepID=A0A7S2NMF7_9EUKA|mmetsp:Transcript_1021/g.1931  ORF Transcript_1021/g.1931 Transcript_1021/m.1931 type:complete len:157 (+) Transcript_1021:73-543(+)